MTPDKAIELAREACPHHALNCGCSRVAATILKAVEEAEGMASAKWAEADKLFLYHVDGGCHAERDVLRAHRDRLLALVRDVAASGCTDLAMRYVEVQIDRATWDELREAGKL